MKAKDSLPFVSVAVCTLGRSTTLKNTVESILDQSYPKNKYEVIMVVDENTRMANKLKKYPIKVLFRKKRSGLSSARNLCVKHSKGEIIAFTDDDCVADKRWLEELVNVFLSDKEVTGVGGIVRPLNPDGVSKAVTLLELVGVAWLDKEEEAGTRRKRIAGINSAYKKAILESIGGWDERIIYGADDVDINHRLLNEKYRLKLTPKAIIYHDHRSSLGEIFRWSQNLGVGYSYYLKKHKNYFRGLLIIMPLLVLLAVPAMLIVALVNFGVLASIILLVLSILGYLGWIYHKSRLTNINLNIRLAILTLIVTLSFSIGGTIGRLKGLAKT